MHILKGKCHKNKIWLTLYCWNKQNTKNISRKFQVSSYHGSCVMSTWRSSWSSADHHLRLVFMARKWRTCLDNCDVSDVTTSPQPAWGFPFDDWVQKGCMIKDLAPKQSRCVACGKRWGFPFASSRQNRGFSMPVVTIWVLPNKTDVVLALIPTINQQVTFAL